MISKARGAFAVGMCLVAACGSTADQSPAATNEQIPTTIALVPPTSTTTSLLPATTSAPDEPEIVVETDIPYYKSEAGTVKKLDVYHPPAAEGLPLVVMFHANPLFGGTKTSMGRLATMVAQRGAVVFVPTYGNMSFDSTEVVGWFREQGPCAVWAALDMASTFGGDPTELVLFGEATGSFPASTVTFSAPSEVSGCVAPPSEAPIASAIFFDQDWFFVPPLWDSVLTEDPDYLATIQPWDDLATPEETTIRIVIGENSDALFDRSVGADSYLESEWIRQRDPDGALADDWAELGALDDGNMSISDVSVLLTGVLVESGWDAELVAIPGVDHSLKTDESKQVITDLIFEGFSD